MSDTQMEVGQKAPEFKLPADSGEIINLAELLAAGRWVVLYFYPKDDTPGCTTEALDFTSKIAEFEALNCSIIGLSKDTPAKHDKFIAKHGLKVRLVSDEDGSTLKQYGSWVEKKMYGRTYMGIDRSTFLIAPDGRVKALWRKVKVKGHVDAVLAALKENQG